MALGPGQMVEHRVQDAAFLFFGEQDHRDNLRSRSSLLQSMAMRMGCSQEKYAQF